MRIWQVVLLLNLALAVGIGFGYGVWGQRLAALDGEITALQAQVDQLAREREARLAGAGAGQQQWEGRGIVRAVYPQLLLITHEDIAGLLPARTTGFRVAEPANHREVHPGDAIRFWLWGTSYDNTVLMRMEAW